MHVKAQLGTRYCAFKTPMLYVATLYLIRSGERVCHLYGNILPNELQSCHTKHQLSPALPLPGVTDYNIPHSDQSGRGLKYLHGRKFSHQTYLGPCAVLSTILAEQYQAHISHHPDLALLRKGILIYLMIGWLACMPLPSER